MKIACPLQSIRLSNNFHASKYTQP